MKGLLELISFQGIAWMHYGVLVPGIILALAIFLWAIIFLLVYRNAFVSLHTPELSVRYHKPMRGIKWGMPVCASALVGLGVIAIAGPERKSFVPYPEYQGACVGISLDTSFSMEAPEKKGMKNTRLARAKHEIETLVNSFPEGDRLALMAFAGSARVFRPAWTTDRERVFFVQLNSINESYVAMYGRTGSNIPRAIGEWFNAFPKDAPCQRFILVFTDGEPEGDPGELEEQLMASLELFAQSKERVTTFIIAIGNHREQMRIPEYDAQGQFAGFAANDDGQYIFSRPNLAYLDDIATRFRAKLIFTASSGTALQEEIASSVMSARSVAAVHKKEIYQSIARPFILAYICVFLMLMFLMLCI
ncbi:MAG: vWA domain-containing protein [Candidatus Sungbacteria bacterium]|nr:VWA domain-containing protein [bacterium]MDZ4260242.1 vWA domain-containing protein [Candidatus Sungbacteria bacterium]